MPPTAPGPTPHPAARAARAAGWIEGWRLVLGIAAGEAVAIGAVLAGAGLGEATLRALIRATAACSLTLFLAAFAASSLLTLAPSRTTRWLRRNRRGLGVSVAASQVWHAALIALLVARFPASFWSKVATTTLVGGGLGYVFLGLMVATSFDRTAAWLGPRRWRRLHTAGMYYLWLVFFTSYLGRVGSPRYAASVALLGAVLALRATAARARARKRARRPRPAVAPAPPA